MTPEEADAAYEAATPVPISRSQIDSIVRSVVRKDAMMGKPFQPQSREIMAQVYDIYAEQYDIYAARCHSGCRTCSDCVGCSHHWVESPMELEWDPTYACKHCDALGDECQLCDNEGCSACNHEGVIGRSQRGSVSNRMALKYGYLPLLGPLVRYWQWLRYGEKEPGRTSHAS
jgi:hypothetical protein